MPPDDPTDPPPPPEADRPRQRQFTDTGTFIPSLPGQHPDQDDGAARANPEAAAPVLPADDGLGGDTRRWQPTVEAASDPDAQLPEFLQDLPTLPDAAPPAQPKEPQLDAETLATAVGLSESAPQTVALNARSPLQRVAALVGLALLLGAVTVPLWQTRARARAVPDDAALARAAGRVAADLRPGDAIAFQPHWGAHRPWLFAKVYADHGLDFDAALLLGTPIDLWDADGQRRLWVVSTHGKGSAVRGARALRHDDLGQGTAVDLYELPSSTTVFDFSKMLHRADQRIGRTGTAPDAWTPCPWQDSPDHRFGGGLHQCGSQEWKNTWRTLHEVGNTRRWGIFVHPPFEHGTLRLAYSDLPRATVLAGRFGNRLWAVRHGDEGSATALKVTVGARLAYTKTLPPDDFGWHAFEVTLGPADQGQPVIFEVEAAKDAWREAVLDARLLAAP
ncbi:MAG: hypothetical protein FJ100_17115 [Deltaproteobacteria bacterium]|nr:hypothetical protein [Deltaproteobacteria bacterium]